MLDFSFTEEQELFRESVREFAQRELAPGYLERARKEEFPCDVLKKLQDQGLLNMDLPEKYGGQGADKATTGIAIEELAKADFNCAFSQSMGTLLDAFGTEGQKEEYLYRVGKGEFLIGIALTEPHCGSDAAAIKTTAIRDGDYYILNGEKSSISMASFAHAFYLFAKTDPAKGPGGVSCFLVPRQIEGITISTFHDMGCKPLGRGALNLRDVRIPTTYRIGEEGMGFKMVMQEFDYIRATIGLRCLGAAQASLQDAIEYARERKAFGKPIARFEGVSFLIAEYATLIEAARLLCYKTLWLRDQGLPHTKEASMCKWWVPKICVGVIHDALLIHGNLGYSDEFPFEQRLRDVIGMELADGTAQIQKIVISREVIGKEFLPY